MCTSVIRILLTADLIRLITRGGITDNRFAGIIEHNVHFVKHISICRGYSIITCQVLCTVVDDIDIVRRSCGAVNGCSIGGCFGSFCDGVDAAICHKTAVLIFGCPA